MKLEQCELIPPNDMGHRTGMRDRQRQRVGGWHGVRRAGRRTGGGGVGVGLGLMPCTSSRRNDGIVSGLRST